MKRMKLKPTYTYIYICLFIYIYEINGVWGVLVEVVLAGALDIERRLLWRFGLGFGV